VCVFFESRLQIWDIDSRARPSYVILTKSDRKIISIYAYILAYKSANFAAAVSGNDLFSCSEDLLKFCGS